MQLRSEAANLCVDTKHGADRFGLETCAKDQPGIAGEQVCTPTHTHAHTHTHTQTEPATLPHHTTCLSHYYTVRQKKGNNFLLCIVFLTLDANWCFFTYIKESIGYNSVCSILACIKNFAYQLK